MSGLTTEYMIKKSDHSIRYDILIDTFHKKIKTFKIGREIHSKIFRIGESKFQIEIHPSGVDKEHKGNVSVYLHNKSDWRVSLEATFKLAHEVYSVDKTIERYYDAYESYGWPTFVGHKECTYDELDEGTFRLQAKITVLDEEVTPERDMTGMKEGVKQALDRQTARLSSEVDVVKEEMRAMKRQHDQELAEIKRGIQELRLSRQANAAESRRRFECPMCTEEARPPMRLKQCGEGHIICDTCYARDEQARQRNIIILSLICLFYIKARQREGRERNQCGVCREQITGRPTALETLLGLS